MSDKKKRDPMLDNENLFTTSKEAQAACLRWQKILRLADWDVVVSIIRKSKFNSSSGAAEIRYELQQKRAVIHLMDPEDWSNVFDNTFPQDHEQALVHELIHLHTAWWPTKPDTEERDLEEQMINVLADAFVELDRRTD